jgi:hypothetical protein
MYYYIANLLVVLFCAFLAQRVRIPFMRSVILGFAFVSMVLLAAVRSDRVGTDTADYVLIFGHTQDLDEALSLNLEGGYVLLNWLVAQVSTEYYALFAAIAIVAVTCYFRIIRKYAVNYEIAFFTLITMGIYGFFFNGARQGLAAAVAALGIQFLIERKLFHYCVCIFLACLFHKSALVLLPAYFLASGYNTLGRSFLIAVVGVGLALSFNSLLSFASTFEQRYDAYGVAGVGGGGLTTLALASQAGFFLWFKSSIARFKEIYHVCLNVFLIGVMIAFVAVTANVNPSGVLRLSYYFTWVVVLIWPIVFVNIVGRSQRHMFLFLFYSLSTVYYVLTLMSFGSMLPYQLNPDVFSF